MKVSEVYNQNVLYVQPNDDLAHVRRLFLKYATTKLPVFEDGVLVGAVTELEVARAYEMERGPIEQVKVSQVMTDSVAAITPADDLDEVIPNVLKKALTVVVGNKGEFLGILTKTEILNTKLSEIPDDPVSSIHKTNVKAIKPEQSIFKAVKIMKENNIKHLPVVQGGQVIGIVSAKDIALSTFGLRPKKLTFMRRSSQGLREVVRIVPQIVGGVMRKTVEKADPKTNIKKVANRMINKGIGSVVVTQRGKLVGIVTKTDLLRAIKI